MTIISGTEFGWCIERGEASAPFYLTVSSGLFDWTQDNGKALRFSRREDADAVASVIGDEVERVAEHGWG